MHRFSYIQIQGLQSKCHSLGCFARAVFLKGQIAGVKKKPQTPKPIPVKASIN